jgi:HPt (histidine-containing phosphotransfer) domain-containing protein
MQQGILTVVEGAVVHPEYSVYLEEIFETSHVAGRDLMDLVFSDTDLGADSLSQIDAAVGACLGQDAMNFVFNQHLLVGEVARRMPDASVKILDLSWSAITDDNDNITRLMLCVRDVTQLRQLAAQASEQRRNLEIIGEILAVSQEKFHSFIQSSNGFIHENERIIRQYSEADSAAIAALFRNMHTIKGNARTYNLQHLTDVVHETEQRYEALRQSDDEDRAWDQDGLMQELARVRETVERYASINEVSLGRKGPGQGAAPLPMTGKERIRESLRLIEAANPASLDDLASMRDAVHRSLRLLGTESFGEALSGVLASLPSLARELGKESPVVRIHDNGYRLHEEAGALLANVFTHLLRNAMDHGIEAADVRRAHGKPAAGQIDIEVGVDQNALQITLSDDGRGLALERIRGIAAERGWIGDGDAPGDEEIAQLIFRPGFSTAQTITAVSGRGVGMDAVHDFLAREKGRIALRFTDDREGAGFRRFQTIIRLPDTFAVDRVGKQADAAAGQAHALAAINI